jgi:hypothetical protein
MNLRSGGGSPLSSERDEWNELLGRDTFEEATRTSDRRQDSWLQYGRLAGDDETESDTDVDSDDSESESESAWMSRRDKRSEEVLDMVEAANSLRSLKDSHRLRSNDLQPTNASHSFGSPLPLDVVLDGTRFVLGLRVDGLPVYRTAVVNRSWDQ